MSPVARLLRSDRVTRGRGVLRSARRLLWALCAGSAVAIAAAQDEVPFVTTPDHVTLAMLELAAVTPRDHVIDLGSGDGRIVVTAARRFGASGLGVELVGDLVAKSRAAARAAGVDGRVSFREGDLFRTDLAPATVVTMYLLPEVNLQLRPRLLALAPGTRIVSHDWDMGDWRPDRSVRLDVPDKTVGHEKASHVHLWVVPARIHGLWCAGSARLDIAQRFQRFSATWQASADAERPPTVFDGALDGTRLASDGPVLLQLDADGSALVARGQRPGEPTQRFTRATGAACG